MKETRLLHPLKFVPILQERLWGGQRLVSQLKKEGHRHQTLGESWELSGVEGHVSEVAEGEFKGHTLLELLQKFKEELVGQRVYEQFGTNFPLLIKFIDAQKDLSIQLHPNDELAQKRHNSFGKTEMWYIMDAEPESRLIMGFKGDVNAETYQKHLDEDGLQSILNEEPVQKGDTFFIQTGTVHAIGAGILLAEIQQSSDITYRLYDWNRKDAQGNTRELHTELAKDAIDYRAMSDAKIVYDQAKNKSNAMVNCPFFTTNYLPVEGSKLMDYSHLDSFVIYVCVSGSGALRVEDNEHTFEKGETLLIPAACSQVQITSESTEILEVYIN